MKALYLEKAIEYFEDNVLLEVTINKLASILKFDYGALNRVMNKLLNENVFTAKIIGNSKICKINLSSDKAIILLSKAASDKKLRFFNKNKVLADKLTEVTNNIIKNSNQASNLIKSIILFGSYAKGKETKKSDTDLLFIVENKKEVSNLIESECNAMNLRYGLRINSIILNSNEFLNALKEKKHNLIKEVIYDKIILYGFEAFWYLLRKNE